MTIISKTKKRLYFVVAAYFKFFANISLSRWHPRIIAVTGSAGKTTMLNLIATQLGPKAHYSHNANSAYGIAFDILGLQGVTASKLYWVYLFIAAPLRAFCFTHHEKFYIVEIDGERPKETEFIAKWLKPELTIWVSLGRSHAVFYEKEVEAGRFQNVDLAIAHEFSTLPKYTKVLVLTDADSELMRTTTEGISARVKALDKKAVTAYKVCPNRSEFTLGKKTFAFSHPMPRDISIQLVMLDALMDYLKLPLQYDLSDYVMPAGRSNFLKGKKGVSIIDSSYNAHLISMSSVLDMFSELCTKHKYLVIGDIIDQGKLEGAEHKALAELIIQAKPERVILVGRRTYKYTYPLLKKHKNISVNRFRKPQEALAFLENILKGGETVLFKGSQYLEWVIEKLLDDPRDAVLLPRQSSAHRRRRAKWGLE